MPASPATPGAPAYPAPDDLREVYQELGTAYHAIEDFRGKLLGLLPFVTASSFAATFLGDPTTKASLLKLVLSFGLLGALVTLGLFMHELNNLRRLEWLRREGYELEKRMNLDGYGFFAPQPESLFNARNAAGLIYSTTFAGWICLGLWFALPGVAIYVSLVVYLASLLFSLPLLGGIHVREERMHVPRTVP
jgi:hypothetical protein